MCSSRLGFLGPADTGYTALLNTCQRFQVVAVTRRVTALKTMHDLPSMLQHDIYIERPIHSCLYMFAM
jgi:hypothetical protein